SRSGIALPRPSYAVGSNGDEGSDRLALHVITSEARDLLSDAMQTPRDVCATYTIAPFFEQRILRLRLRMTLRARSRGRLGSLAVQLDHQLFLRRDRNARPLRTLEHPAAERLLVDREPSESGTAGRQLHRRLDSRHLARLLTDANLFA